MGEGEPEIGEADAEQARQQHGLASMAVAESAPERAEKNCMRE
jgi:hypothetical protein